MVILNIRENAEDGEEKLNISEINLDIYADNMMHISGFTIMFFTLGRAPLMQSSLEMLRAALISSVK